MNNTALLSRARGSASEYKRIYDQASQLVKIGAWECNLKNEELIWTDGVYDLFELPRGSTLARASIVDLYDNARIVRAPGYGDPQMQADSQHFRVLVNDDVIETEKPVKLQRGMSVMTASGMNYNNVTRVMQLFGNVKGNIAPSEAGGSSPKQPG